MVNLRLTILTKIEIRAFKTLISYSFYRFHKASFTLKALMDQGILIIHLNFFFFIKKLLFEAWK